MFSGILRLHVPAFLAKMPKDRPLLFLAGDADPVGEQGKGVQRAIQSLKDCLLYTSEQLTGKEPSLARCEATDELLSLLDVLVDGEFVQAKHDISLRFRGRDVYKRQHLT